MTEPSLPPDAFYRLDREDRIIDWGGAHWARFARENGNAALAEAQPERRSIYDFVAGRFTQRFLADLFAEARASDVAITRRYRCDSPTVMRLMEMRVLNRSAGELLVEHRLFESRPLQRRVETHEQGGAAGARIYRCSMCSRLRTPSTPDWREPEATFDAAIEVDVLHIVCADCRRGPRSQFTRGGASAGGGANVESCSQAASTLSTRRA